MGPLSAVQDTGVVITNREDDTCLAGSIINVKETQVLDDNAGSQNSFADT
jgi:hypothetical protein